MPAVKRGAPSEASFASASSQAASSRKRQREEEADPRGKKRSLDEGSSAADGRPKKLQKCNDCRRTSDDPNPCPDRHPGPTLNFTSETSGECLPCRNWWYSCGRSQNRAKFRESLKTEEGHRDYMPSLHEHEVLFNDSAGKQLRDVAGKSVLPDVIKRVAEEAYEDTTFLGVFWPDWLLDKKKFSGTVPTV